MLSAIYTRLAPTAHATSTPPPPRPNPLPSSQWLAFHGTSLRFLLACRTCHSVFFNAHARFDGVLCAHLTSAVWSLFVAPGADTSGELLPNVQLNNLSWSCAQKKRAPQKWPSQETGTIFRKFQEIFFCERGAAVIVKSVGQFDHRFLVGSCHPPLCANQLATGQLSPHRCAAQLLLPNHFRKGQKLTKKPGARSFLR